MKPNWSGTPSNREDALQKIVKNQEQIIRDLEGNIRKYKEKSDPDISRLEQELKLKDNEIELLTNKIRDIQSGYNQEKVLLNQYIEKSQGGFDNLKVMLSTEREKYDKKTSLLEENYKIKVASLENENRLLTEELIRLKGYYLKETDKKSSVQVDENIEMLEDLKRMNEIFVHNESEHKAIIQQLKKEIEENLDMFNQHLSKCSQEKKELSNAYLENLAFLNPESVEFKKFVSEFNSQIRELMVQLTKKDAHNQALVAHIDRVSADFEQVRQKYDALIRNEEENQKIKFDDSLLRETEKIRTENEKLKLLLKEKDTEISSLRAEVETLKIESQLMEQNLEDIKKIASAREWNSLNEIQALKMNNIKLTDIDANRQKIVDEQLSSLQEEREKMISFQSETIKVTQSLLNLSEEVELVHRRLEEICRKQKEFFEKQQENSQTFGKQKFDNFTERTLDPITEESDSRERPKDASVDERLDTKGGAKSTRRANTLQEFKAVSIKNTDIEKIKENELAKHRNELNSLRVFWDKCLDSLVPVTQSVEEFHAGLKEVSSKIEYLQTVVIPEKKLIDFVNEEINKFMDLVDDYNHIKDEICDKVAQDLEIAKYQEKIKKLEYELELMNVSLIHYMQSTEALKNMINTNKETEEQGHISILTKEIQRLQDQNNLLLANNKRLEQLYDGEINELMNQVKTKNEYDLKMYTTLEDLMLIFNEYKEAVVVRERERLTLTEEVGSIKEYLRYGENMAKELKSLIYNSKQKVSTKNIGDRLKALENEELLLLRNQVDRLEQKSTRLEKVVSEERAFLAKKARELDLLENNPLKLYEELYEASLQEKTVIERFTEQIDFLDQIYNNVLVDIQNRIDFTSEEEARNKLNLDYHETIEILKAELHIVKEEANKEKALISGEIQVLTENFKKSYEVLKKKYETMEKILTEGKLQNEELKEYNMKLELQYQEAINKLSEDFHRKFIAHKEMMNTIVQEARKYKEESAVFKNQFKDIQEDIQSKYKASYQRLEKMIDQSEYSLHEMKKLAAEDLSRRKKIEEDAIKENLNLYNLLKTQINSLKKQVDDGENARIQEKSIFVGFVENFKQSLSQLKLKIAQDRKKYEDETEFYRRLLNEKDSLHEQEVKTLRTKYDSQLQYNPHNYE